MTNLSVQFPKVLRRVSRTNFSKVAMNIPLLCFYSICNKLKSKGVFNLLCVLFVVAATNTVSATTWYVNDGSTAGDIYCTAVGSATGTGTASDPFDNLDDVLKVPANINAGDIIYVDAGTYNAYAIVVPSTLSLNEGMAIMDDNVSIIGAGMGVTVFYNNDGGNNSGKGLFLSVNANGFTLKDLTVDSYDNETNNGLGVTPVGGQAINIGNLVDNLTNILLDGVAVINSGNPQSGASQSAVSIAEGAQVVVRNSAFSNNGNSTSNSAAGGAMTIVTGDAGNANPPRRMTDVYIENTVFNCNNRLFGTGGGGGAIHIMSGSPNDAGSVELRNCSFYGNRADASGGAICSNAGTLCDLKIIGCTFEGNYSKAATDRKGGGAIAVMGGTNAYIYNCTFTDNGTRAGNIIPTSTTFQADGGAILIDNTTQASENVSIERCSFTDNYTGASADAGLSTGHDIAISRGIANIRNCFFNNTYTDGTASDDFVNIAFVSGSTNPPTVNISNCGTLVTNGQGAPITQPEYALCKMVSGVGQDCAPAANLTGCATIAPMNRSSTVNVSAEGWTDNGLNVYHISNREAMRLNSAGANTISPVYYLPNWSTVTGATLRFDLGNFGGTGIATDVQVFISTNGGATFPATPNAIIDQTTGSTAGVPFPTVVNVPITPPYPTGNSYLTNIVVKIVAPSATASAYPVLDNIRVEVCSAGNPTDEAHPVAIASAAIGCSPPSVAPPIADLQLVKTVSTTRPTVGSVITYTITITNNGPDAATGVSVEDILPVIGLSNITAISNGGALSGSAITWNNLSVAGGANLALTFQATVAQSGGSYVNVAEIIGSDVQDPDSTPNNNTETTGNIGSVDSDGTQDATDEDDVDDAVITPCPQPNTIYIAPPSCYAPTSVSTQNTNATADLSGATPFATWKAAYDFAIAHPTVTTINFMPGTYVTAAPSTNWGDADGGYVLPAGLTVNGNGAVIDNTPLQGTGQVCFATLGNNTTINGLSFIKFSGASGNGGALNVPSTANNWTISNCNFESCNLFTDAVSVIVGAGTTGNITGCNFYRNSNPLATYSSSPGNSTSSALFITGSNTGDLNVTNTTFSCNFSNDGGGAVDITNAHVDFSGCSFTKNEANASVGGAVDISGAAVVSFTNTDFTGNFTSGGTNFDGGAVSIISNATVSFTGCNFSDNGHVGATWVASADTRYGGAIYVANSPNAATTGNPVTVTNCQFYNNTANLGGGIYGDISTNISVTNSYFTGNYAGSTNSTTHGGGGIYIDREAASCQVQNIFNVTGSTFIGNKIARNSNTGGAGIKLYGACPITSTITTTLIDDNKYNAASSTASGTSESNYTATDGTGITLTNNQITATSSTTQTNASAGYTGTISGADPVPNTCPVTTAPATACLTACGINIAGTLFNDSDALTDGNVDGTPIGTASGTQLYANLVQGGAVVQTVTLPANGQYTFANVTAGSYTVVIATSATATTPGTLPSNWTNVGEAFGTNNTAGTGNEGGTPNGSIAVTIGATDVTGVNFGIKQANADLQLVKTVSDATPNVGDVITFTIAVTNNGPDDATGVSVEDVVPNGYSNITAISDAGVNASGTITWTGLSIANGATETLTFNATVVAPGTGISYANVAEVIASDQPDPDSTPNNNTATTGNIGSVDADGTQNTTAGVPEGEDDVDDAVVAPEQADLSIIKSVSSISAAPGASVTFTIAVTNNGPDAATNVDIKDIVPAGYNNIININNSGVLTGTTIDWANQSIANGATLTLTFDATVLVSGNHTNVAMVTDADQFDPDSTPNNAADTDGDGNIGAASGNTNDTADANDEDDADEATVTLTSADLQLVKTVSDATPNVGDVVTFTIAITNNGPDGATGVSAEDIVPNGYSNITAISDAGVNASGTITWTGLSIANGATKNLTFNATVVAPGVGISYANVAEVIASDQPDPDSTPNNNTATTGNIGSVDADGTQNTTAGVPEGEDDVDDAVVAPEQADLSIIKSVSSISAAPGASVTFTIAVTNNGPDAATNVDIQDIVPTGYNNIININNSGVLTGTTIDWANQSIANGATLTLTFDATVLVSGNHTNVAMVTDADQFDPDSTPNNAADTDGDGNIGAASGNTNDTADANDEDDADDAIVEVPRISLVKGSSLNLGANSIANAGDIITFTYTVTNTGNVPLTNVSIGEASFTGSAGVGAISSIIYQTSSDPVTLQGTLSVGESATYTATYAITALDIAAGFVDNQAQAVGTSPANVVVNDLSDSSNPADANETGTQSDPNGSDPTNTPIPAPCNAKTGTWIH